MKRKRKIVIDSGKIKIVLNLSSSAKVKPAKVTFNPPIAESPWSPEDEKILFTFFDSVDRTIKELVLHGRKHGAVGKTESFPESRVRELREKMVNGLAEWALLKLGREGRKYLREAEKDFFDRFLSHYFNPSRDTPRDFWDSFHQGRFRVPTKLPRTQVHHRKWLKLWREYNLVCDRLDNIPRETRRITVPYLCALKERLPGFPEGQLARLVESNSKPSDLAAEYVSQKFKLPVGGQALKEYFNVFHRPHGYFDFISLRAFKLE